MITPLRSSLLALSISLAAHTAFAQSSAPTEFWRALGDTTLVRLVGETRLANRDIQIAAARASGARAVRSGAVLDLLPVVTTRGGYTRQRISAVSFPGASGSFPDQNLWDAGVALSWDVDVAGRGRQSLRGQSALVDAAGEDVRDVEVALTAQVANAYLALRGAQDRLAVARRNAENQHSTLEVTERRLEAGRGTALDRERASSQLSATLAVIPALESTIESARQRIKVLTGRARTEELTLPPCESGLELPEAPALGGVDAVVRDRPDVRSAERQLAARSAFVGAARAEYWPRLSIGGAAGYTGTTARSLGNTGTPRYLVGPVLSWPGLDLGHVRASVAAARAEETQSRVQYELTVAQAQEELETSLLAYRKARERLKHLEDAAAASTRAAELARLRYVEGGSDFLQVLDAERTMLERENERALGRTAAETGLIAVYRALGGANAFGSTTR